MEWILLLLFILYAAALCVAAIKVNAECDHESDCYPDGECELCPEERCEMRRDDMSRDEIPRLDAVPDIPRRVLHVNRDTNNWRKMHGQRMRRRVSCRKSSREDLNAAR